MAAHLPLFVKGSIFSLPSSTSMSSSCTYSSISHTVASPGFHSSPAAANKSVKLGTMQRMDGVRSVKHRMTSLHGKMKKRQQIKASAQAPNGTYTHPDYVPEANFYKVEAMLRPWRVSHVTSGLLKMGIRGVTVSDVRGFGVQAGSAERQAGSEFSKDNFVSKVKMEIVVSKDQLHVVEHRGVLLNVVLHACCFLGFQVEAVIDTIIDEARTGEIGDGKIFVVPVADVIRVRTGERGLEAERMAGGRSEILTGVRQEVTDSN